MPIFQAIDCLRGYSEILSDAPPRIILNINRLDH